MRAFGPISSCCGRRFLAEVRRPCFLHLLTLDQGNTGARTAGKSTPSRRRGGFPSSLRPNLIPSHHIPSCCGPSGCAIAVIALKVVYDEHLADNVVHLFLVLRVVHVRSQGTFAANQGGGRQFISCQFAAALVCLYSLIQSSPVHNGFKNTINLRQLPRLVIALMPVRVQISLDPWLITSARIPIYRLLHI